MGDTVQNFMVAGHTKNIYIFHDFGQINREI